MIVYGKNVAETIFRREDLYSKVRKIYFEASILMKNKNFIPESLKSCAIECSKEEIDRLAQGLHQGIMLDMEDYQYMSLSDLLAKNPNFIVLLDHLEDPHNLGAIIRTCSAAGVDAILLPTDRQVQINATVMKTSAGTLYDVPIVSVVNLASVMNELKQNGFWLVGTDMNGTDYTSIDYSGKIGLVIGNEGKGMHRLVRETCDFIATIPMVREVDSLNASVASGIMIYEVVRHRK